MKQDPLKLQPRTMALVIGCAIILGIVVNEVFLVVALVVVIAAPVTAAIRRTQHQDNRKRLRHS